MRYVPETQQLFFVSPGDRIVDANGVDQAVVPYKGVIMSNQRYLQWVTGE